MTTTTPRQAVEAVQAHPRLPEGDDERFTGYGVMGMPFASGHYLALRDFVATSVGPAYRAIWHRDPQGRWTIHTTGAPELTCPRYFGSVTATAQVPSISVSWRDDHTLDVTLGDELSWRIELEATPATRMMTTMGGDAARGRVEQQRRARRDGADGAHDARDRTDPPARRDAERPRVQGGAASDLAPRRRRRVVPRRGPRRAGGRLGRQTRLGDFWLPQRGVFFVGRARSRPRVSRSIARRGAAGTTMGR